MRTTALLILASLCFTSAVRAQSGQLGRYNLSDERPFSVRLSSSLGEASGMACTDDGRLLMHNDEEGMVYDVDMRTGKVRSSFGVGRVLLREDLEGIAVKGDSGYVVTSAGRLFGFPLGRPGERVAFSIHRTPLTAAHDVEGLEYDPVTDCLLLACKGDGGRGAQRGQRAVYAWSLKTRTLLDTPRFLVNETAVGRAARKGRFRPSGLARHPESGTFFLVSSDGFCVVELSAEGAMLGAAAFPRRVNPRAEGIAFAPDGSLLICNDGQGGPGSLTVYPRLP
jgi:hypothetical protein